MSKKIACGVLIGAALLSGCDMEDFFRTDPVAKSTRKPIPVQEPEPEVWEAKIEGNTLRFRYMEVDGHQYFMFTGFHRGGITHSPKCPCLNAKEKEAK